MLEPRVIAVSLSIFAILAWIFLRSAPDGGFPFRDASLISVGVWFGMGYGTTMNRQEMPLFGWQRFAARAGGLALLFFLGALVIEFVQRRSSGILISEDILFAVGVAALLVLSGFRYRWEEALAAWSHKIRERRNAPKHG